MRLRERRVEVGLPVPLQLQVLEADHLDGQDRGLRDGGFILQGIEFDRLGRSRAYWLIRPVPATATGARVNRVSGRPRAAPLRAAAAGQVRGVPSFAPVMLKLRDLDAYDEAESVRKKIEACFVAFVTAVQDEEDRRKVAP